MLSPYDAGVNVQYPYCDFEDGNVHCFEVAVRVSFLQNDKVSKILMEKVSNFFTKNLQLTCMTHLLILLLLL